MQHRRQTLVEHTARVAKGSVICDDLLARPDLDHFDQLLADGGPLACVLQMLLKTGHAALIARLLAALAFERLEG